MPKNKFNGFYYGVGMKLDEASVDQAGQQLEGRLNQVVDNITRKVSTISDAITKGMKGVDTKELVQSLAAAQQELNQFNNFDPSKLQKQIDQLNSTVGSLGDQFKDVSSQLKVFTDDVQTRLSNIEIKTSKQGKDALKKDLLEMKQLAQGYSNVLSKGEKIDTSGLDRYIKKIRDGLASIKQSGNPLEMFADNELAHSFVDITKILRQMGVSADNLRDDFYELSSTFKQTFEKSNAKGASTIFKDVGYQIETVNTQLRKAKAELAQYEASIAKAQSRTQTTGFNITIKDDKNLNFDQKIAKIQEYGDIIAEMDYGEAWATATRNQIALIQAAERELQNLLQTSEGQNALQKWQNAFGKYDLTEKLSTGAIDDYVQAAKEDLQRLQVAHAKVVKEIQAYETEVGKLKAKEAITTSTKKSKKVSQFASSKQKTDGGVAEVTAKIKINETEWAKTINAALTNIATKEKVKPFKIKVEATQGKILEEIKKIKEATLMDKKNNGEKDVVKFNDNFDKFITNLKTRKEELITELKQNWHPALKDAFTFKMELLGIDNKSMTNGINMHMLNTVDTINETLAAKPIEFHSNINQLLEEIQEKIKDAKFEGNIGLTTGNITGVAPALSNVTIVTQGIAQGASVPQSPSVPVVTPTSQPTPSVTASFSKQEIYEDAINRVTKMLSETSDPSEALKKVRDGAQKLYKQLNNAEEGTEEYYKAQILLTTLLSKWRSKIGGKNADSAFKVTGVLGSRGANKTWNQYLLDNGILPSDTSNRVIGSASKLEEMYSLTKPKATSTTKRTKTKPNDLETAEQVVKENTEHGRQMVQHYIKLAQWAKLLKPIADTTDIEIKESMFKDRESTKIRGKWYNKSDIGTVIPGDKLDESHLDAFLSKYKQYDGIVAQVAEKEEQLLQIQKAKKELEPSLLQEQRRIENELTQLESRKGELSLEEIQKQRAQIKNNNPIYKQSRKLQTQEKALNDEIDQLIKDDPTVRVLGFLRKLIDSYKSNKQQLDTLLQEHAKSDAVVKYNAADNKAQYLTTDIASVFKRIMSKNGPRQAQTHISNIFGKHNVDLSGLLSTKDVAEQWHIIQTQLLGKEGLNFDALMGELGSLKGNVGKTYENFMTLLKVSRAYMLASNSLGEIGQEAAALQGGRKEPRDKYRKEYDPHTGRSYYTDEKIGTKNTVVEQGFRQLLNDLAVTFKDESGNIIAGYNAGKGVVPSDSYLSSSASYTSIIGFLTKMLNSAIEVAIDTGRKGAKGYTGVSKHETPVDHSESLLKNYKFTTINTEKSNIEQWIKNINILISSIKMTLKSLDGELSTIVASDDNPLKSMDDIKSIGQTQSQIDAKSNELQQKRTQIAQQKSKIEEIQNAITNPVPLYEDILKSLLQEQIAWTKLESEISSKRANKKTYNDELEIDKLVEQKSQLKNRIENLKATAKVAVLGTDDTKINAEINKETAEIARLESELQQKQSTASQNEKYLLEREIARKREYVENLSTALQTRERVKPKEALENELAQRQSEFTQMQNEEVELKNQLSLLNNELEKFGSADVVKRVAEIVREQQRLTEQINEKQALLKQRQKEVKAADGKTKSYSKSYSQAVNDLPVAQQGHNIARANLATLVNQYTAERMATVTDALSRQQSGALSDAEVKKMQDGLHNVVELNAQLQKGTITQADYVEKVTQAYILMRNASTDEAKATAKSDAEKLAGATLLVQKYKEEEAILQKIIATQKPKETVPVQDSGSNNKSSANQPQTTPRQTVGNISANTATSTTINDAQNVVIPGGNIVLGGIAGGNNSDIVDIKNTVNRIYSLLSVRKDGNHTSRIEELKKLIAMKEDEERKALETVRQKTEEEKKAVEKVKEKVTEETKHAKTVKKTSSTQTEDKSTKATVEKARKSAEEQARKAQEEAEHRAREEAERKAKEQQALGHQERKRVDEITSDPKRMSEINKEIEDGLKKRAIEGEKQVAEAQSQTAEAQKRTLEEKKQTEAEQTETTLSQKQVTHSQEFEANVKKAIGDLLSALSFEKVYKGNRPEPLSDARLKKDNSIQTLMSMFGVDTKDVSTFTQNVIPSNAPYRNGVGARHKMINKIYGNLMSFYGDNIQDVSTGQMVHSILDPVQKALDKEIPNLFSSFVKYNNEVEASLRVFREHYFSLKNDKVIGVDVGNATSVSPTRYSDITAGGHMHPTHDLYSVEDLAHLRKTIARNPNYNTDYLVTPRMMTKLDGLKNMDLSKLGAFIAELEKAFPVFHQIPFTEIRDMAKLSFMKHKAEQYGVGYSASVIDENGQLSEAQIKYFSDDIVNKLLDFEQKKQQFKNTGKDDPAYKTLSQEIRHLDHELNQNEAYKSARNVGLGKEGSWSKLITTSAIQSALDNNWDISKFYSEIESLINKSPDNEITKALKDFFKSNEDEDTKNIQQILPELRRYFGYGEKGTVDDRAYSLLNSKGFELQVLRKKFGMKVDEPANMSLNDLRAELARLEELQNNGEVDPRFATAAKQDIIINLLKNGIKVIGTKSSKDGSDTNGDAQKTPRVPQMPNVAKASLQADEISKLTNINKDSSLYKQYVSAKKQLDDTVAATVAKGKGRTKDDTDQIRALSSAVTSLGKQIINTANNFDQFKANGGDAFAFTTKGVQSLEDEMRELAHNDALNSKSLLKDISYDKVTQKLSYSLTDLEGNITRVTMAYDDLLGMVLKTSNKTTTSASKLYNAIEGEMTKKIGVDDTVEHTPILGDSRQYQAYNAAFGNMMDAQIALRQKGAMATKAEKDELISLINKTEEARRRFEQLAHASTEFDAKIRGGNTKSGVNPSNLESEMKSFVLSQEGLTKSQKEMIEQTWTFKNAQDGATYSVRTGKHELASMSVIFDEGTKRIGQYTVETKKYKTGMESFMGSLKGKWQELARYLMTFGSMYRVFAMLRQGITYIREIDSALTELKKVTDETEETYDRFLQTAAKTADKVGSTIKEVVSSTADWARIGYNLQDAATLAESTAILLNVSEFQSIEDATSALTSTLQAFGYTADQSMDVVDVMNEIGNNFAISSDGIATALQDSASSLMAANNSYEEAVAMIAAANRVVQDPNSVGAALRTISLRLRGTSVEELEEAGEDTAGVITSKSKLQGKIKSLAGVDILTDTGAYKSTYDILLDISKVWEDMSDINQAALLEILAGKTRSNTAAAILSNTKDLKEAYAQAMEAEGSALEENEKYLDSIQGRIDLFNNSIQTMWSNALDSDVVKDIVDLGTGLVKIVDQLGLVKTLVVAIGTYLIKKHFKGDLFGGLAPDKNLKQMKTRLQQYKEEYRKAQEVFDTDNSKGNKQNLNRTQNKYEKYKNQVDPQIKEYDALEDKLTSLQDKRQSLMNDLNKGQAHEDFLGKRMAAGYNDAAKAIDKVHTNNEQLKGQIHQLDTEIANTKARMDALGNSGLTTGQKIKAGFKTAWTSIKQFGKELIKSMAWSAAIMAAFESLNILGGWLDDAWDALKPKSFEDFQEALEQTESKLSNVESEIRSLESELDDANGRIDELMDQGTLTFVEQEELDNLKSATKELEAQIALKKTLQQTLQEQANNQAIEANEAYLDTSFMSEQSKTERQEEWGETGKEIGTVVGTVAGGIIGGFIAGPFGVAAGAAIGNGIISIIGGWIGEGVAGASYDSEQTVGEAMDNMVANREKLLAKQREALADQDTEAYNEATEALRTYDNQMAKHISQIQENYNAMDWEKATTDEKKKMIEYADWLSKYSIEMKTTGAKNAAIERIFGVEADEDLKSIKKKLEDIAKTSQDFTLSDILSEEEFTKLMQRLNAVGVGAGDVALFFKDAYQAEVDAMNDTSTESAVQEVANLTSGIKALKDAFNEFRTEGKMTADTLIGLKDIFGETDGWDDFITTVSTGTATIEQMTAKAQELAENYVNDIIKPENWNPDEYLTYISYLESLGVKDAQKFLDAKLTQAAVEAFINGAYDTIEEAEKAYSNEDHTVEVPQELIDAAQIKKAAEDKAKTTSDNKIAYDKQKSAYDSASANQKLYETYKTYLTSMGVNIENITEAFKQGLTAQQMFDHYASQMPQSFEKLYNNAKQAYEDGYNDKFLEYKYQLEDYGVDTENLTNAFKYGYGASDIWMSRMTMPDNFKIAYNQMKDLYEQGTTDDLPEITVPATTQLDVDNADAEAKKATETYQEVLDKYGLVLDVQLFEVNDLIDDLQGIYDTLTSAAKEYAANGGYVSVDTLQTLLGLDAKYIGLLYDEQGQLNLNTESIQRMTQARVMEAAVLEAQSYLRDLENVAMAGNIESIAGLVESTYIATDAEWGFVDAKLASIQATMIANGVSEEAAQQYTEQARHNIASIKKLAEQTNANIQNTISSSDNNAKDNTNDALEQLQKKYERQIKNLDNQQTYIQNEIDRLEAEDKAVSKSYYEQQIGLEEQKLALYEQEREALLKLDMTDEVADALWEVEHAIQESTMRMVEFRQSIIDLYKTAFDDVVGAYDDKDNLLSDRQEYIEKYRELLELQNSPETASGYQEQIDLETSKMRDNIAELAVLESTLASAMASGLKAGGEEWIEMQEQIRATEAAILDNKIAIEQYKEELKNIPVEAFNSVRDAFSFQDDFLSNQQEYIEGYADYLETIGVDVPQELYDQLIAIEQDKRENTLANLVDSRHGFDDIQAQGFTAADEEWQDAYNQIVELEKKIQDSDTAIAEWQQTIRELDFEKFERFISRFDDLESELEHLRGLFDDEDVAFEDGTWTKEGLTSLGLLYQQMQLNQAKAQEYAQKIEELNDEYDKGSMSEQEYYEQLQELKEGQWGAIESYEDAKDAIVDMEEARIDMIEEGINEEIEAYEELIDLKREELDAERDLYNFKKDTEEQTKNIAELQRKIASLSGSDDASDIATRRKLEAELRDAQAALDDSYYNHAMDSQSDALDNELEAYKKGKDDYLEMLRDTLDDTQAIIESKIAEVLSNADTVLESINTTAGEHGVTLNNSLTQPWKDAASTATAFKTGLDETLPLMTNEDGVITVFSSTAKSLLTGVFGVASTAASDFKGSVDTQLGLIKTAVETSSSELTSKIQFPWRDTTKEDGPLATFSTKAKGAIGDALDAAKTNAETMKSYLSSPWTNATTAVNTFSTTVSDTLDSNLEKVKKHVEEINKENAKIKTPDYVGSGDNDGSGSGTGGTDGSKKGKTANAELKTSLKTFTASVTNTTIEEAKKEARIRVLNQARNHYSSKGYKDAWIDKQYNSWYNNVKFHAKGTLGTKKDEWAITDESWIGEEITLAAGKNGQLQYLKKGSAVMPADISENLVEWGKINPNMMHMPNTSAGLNIISNAIAQPNYEFSFDSLVHVDHCDESTLKDLEKMVDTKIDQFSKQMNYAIKRYK